MLEINQLNSDQTKKLLGIKPVMMELQLNHLSKELKSGSKKTRFVRKQK